LFFAEILSNFLTVASLRSKTFFLKIFLKFIKRFILDIIFRYAGLGMLRLFKQGILCVIIIKPKKKLPRSFHSTLMPNGKKIALISSIVLSYLLIITGIVLYAVFATERCRYTYDGSTSDCPSSLSFSHGCTNIYSVKYELDPVTITHYCPWYTRDVGLGEAALGLSFIFVTLIALKTKLNLAPQIRIGLGILSALTLLAAVILSFVDLFDIAIQTGGYSGLTVSRAVFKANGAMVILSFVMVVGLTVWDFKTRNVSSKVTKGDNQAVKLPVY
jgi:hypothetical protein